MIVSDVVMRSLEDDLADDPCLCRMVRQKWEEIPRFWDGVFVQRAHDKPITLTQKYAALKCYAAVYHGALWFNPVHIGATPYTNKEAKENNAALSRLAQPYKAEFCPGPSTIAGCSDGWFEWDGDDDGFIGLDEASMKCRGSLPLEVGTTEAGKTYLYLHAGSGLARWPYGSEIIYVFQRNPQHEMWAERSNAA